MKFSKLIIVAVALVFATSANAFDLSSLKNLFTDGTASEILDNIIQKDDVSIADIAGTWKSTGPAVSFKSENLLEKAGGVAAATTIENKLKPYYKKAGMENATFTFTKGGAVTITLKSGRTITGTVTKGTTKGTLIFNFSKLTTGSKLSKITAYVTKGTTMSIMFDVSKLLTLANAIAKYSGNSTISTAATLLNSYKGMYAGFKFAAK